MRRPDVRRQTRGQAGTQRVEATVRYPTAHAGGVSAPLAAVRARLEPTRRSQGERAARHLLLGRRSRGGCRCAPGGGSAAPRAARRARNRRTGWEPVRGGTGPPVDRVAGNLPPTGAPRRGGSWLALRHQKPVPARGDHPNSGLKGGAARPPHARKAGALRRTDDERTVTLAQSGAYPRSARRATHAARRDRPPSRR